MCRVSAPHGPRTLPSVRSGRCGIVEVVSTRGVISSTRLEPGDSPTLRFSKGVGWAGVGAEESFDGMVVSTPGGRHEGVPSQAGGDEAVKGALETRFCKGMLEEARKLSKYGRRTCRA